MIKKFIKFLMDRKKKNEKFKKDFLKKTGVDLNQVDAGSTGNQQLLILITQQSSYIFRKT